MLSTPLRFVSAVFGLSFAAFAALQYNDPDPLQWMAIYGLAALTCAVAAAKGKVDFRLPAAVALAASIWAAVDLPEVLGHKSFIDNLRLGEGMMDTRTEVSREVGGLVLVIAVMVPLAIGAFRNRVRPL